MNNFIIKYLLIVLLGAAQFGMYAQTTGCIGNVSTGISNANAYLGVGGTDPNWSVVSSPGSLTTPVPAIVCPTYTPFWVPTPILTPATNAGWINVTNSFSGHKAGVYIFERKFTVAPATGILDLNFGVAVDDVLNSLSLIPPTGPAIPLTVTFPSAGTYFTSSFPTPRAIRCPVAGVWKIRAEVKYVDAVGGFLLSGNIACRDSICGPCMKASITKAVCGPIVGGLQTYIISGTVNNGNNVATTLGVSLSSGGGSAVLTSSTTVPANAVNHPFTLTYTVGSQLPCFVFTLSVQGRVLCRETVCRDLPLCPPVADPCCPKVKVVYSSCYPLPLKHGTFTVSGPKCLSSITIAWSAGLNPAGTMTFTGASGSPVAWGGISSYTHNFSPAANAVNNLQFVLSSALATNGTVTVSFVLCDGTKCTETFIWKGKNIGDPIELSQVKSSVAKVYLSSFNLKTADSESKPKYIAVGFSNRNEIAAFKPTIMAITGAKHPADPHDPKVMAIEKSAHSGLNAVFELEDNSAYEGQLLMVYQAEKPDLQLDYVIFDAEGGIIGSNTLKLAAQLVTTDTKEVSAKSATRVSLFPNPANAQLNVTYTTDAAQQLNITVLDILGRPVEAMQSVYADKGNNEYTVDTANLVPGTYVLQINSKNGVQTYAFQVAR